MAVKGRQAISVGSVHPVRLDAEPGDTLPGSGVLVIAQGTGTLCLGGGDYITATADSGRVPVVLGTIIPVDLDHNEELWGIAVSGSITVDVLLVGA